MLNKKYRNYGNVIITINELHLNLMKINNQKYSLKQYKSNKRNDNEYVLNKR